MSTSENTEIATFAGGCFWCMEAVFQRLKGVISVESGYTGGVVPNPTYDQVCTGKTGHAEALQIVFNPSVISYEVLLDIFFHLHDPTQLNRQGNDVGTQYRSAIFYHTDRQRQSAEKVKSRIDAEKIYTTLCVTQIVPASTFYKAESYHEDYYNKNSYQPYCQYVIDPKVNKLMAEYGKLVKDTGK